MPLTANNKVDRAALPPVTLGPADGTGGSAPETGLQANVAQAWSTVLGHEVPVTGNFFEAGRPSPAGARATAAVRRLLGREVPLRLTDEHRDAPRPTRRRSCAKSVSDLGAASREHRLRRETWHSRAPRRRPRRVDLFVTIERIPRRPGHAGPGGARRLGFVTS